MDNFLIVLITVLVIFLLLFIIYVILSLISFKDLKTEKTDLPICTQNINELYDVTKLECCYNPNEVTNLKYVPELNLVVSTKPSYYLDICKSLCYSGFNTVTGKCNNYEDQQEFDNCTNKLKPINCKGSVPVAYEVKNNETIFYYAFSTDENLCTQKGKCF